MAIDPADVLDAMDDGRYRSAYVEYNPAMVYPFRAEFTQHYRENGLNKMHILAADSFKTFQEALDKCRELGCEKYRTPDGKGHILEIGV